MNLQSILQRHCLHPVVDQFLGVLADLTVKPWILQRRPCLRDCPLFGPQAWKGSRNPQRSDVIAACPSGFELAQFRFGGHGRGVVACSELSKPKPQRRNRYEFVEQ
jgi:hypothetical protein